MVASRDLYRETISACYSALRRVGFVEYKKKWVDWPLGNGFHAWVGLNEACEEGFVEISPFAGIHVVQIEKMWKSIDGEIYRRSGSTYSCHLGELSPHERAFRFFPDTNFLEEADRLADLYLNVGLPYSKSISNYDTLLPILKERVDTLGAYPERVACCLYLMGRISESREFVKEFMLIEADYFGKFSDSFLDFIDKNPS